MPKMKSSSTMHYDSIQKRENAFYSMQHQKRIDYESELGIHKEIVRNAGGNVGAARNYSGGTRKSDY